MSSLVFFFRVSLLFAVLLLAMTGCAAGPAAQPLQSDGATESVVEELSEPALHLSTIDSAGIVSQLDLRDGAAAVIAEIDPADRVETNGRFILAIRDGSVTVIDSGVWTRSHGDHFHYYEGAARILGEVHGEGTASVTVGERGIGLLFDGEAVLLDLAALADGDLSERFRVAIAPHDGLVVPLAYGAAVTEADANGDVQAIRVLSADGTIGERIECAQAAGTIATSVGVVIGCADGAVLAVDADPKKWERIAYPEGVSAAATCFEARRDRPSAAALGGDSGVWILDTRAREWTFYDVGRKIEQAVAVDDDEERVLLLAADGSVMVLSDGAIIAQTEALVGDSLSSDETASHVSFVVDRDYAYLNGPREHALWEIDLGEARIERVFNTSSDPLLLAGTGR